MFEGLKKKFSNFIDNLSKKEKETAQQAPTQEQQGAAKEEAVEEHKPQPLERRQEEQHEEPKPAAAIRSEPVKAEKAEDKGQAHTVRVQRNEPEIQHHIVTVHHKTQAEQPRAIVREEKQPEHVVNVQKDTQKQEERHVQRDTPKETIAVHKPQPVNTKTLHEPQVQKVATDEVKAPEPQERQVQQEHVSRKEPKVTAMTRIKGFIFGHVKISEKDADPFIEELRIGLLQSDVNYDVAEKVTNNIRRALVGREVESRNIGSEIRQGIRSSIMDVLTKGTPKDIVSSINEKKAKGDMPFKILFIGPNGAGKTTTMAKIANMLISNNITCVLSASDTFRAAAIEQTVIHASRLGINVIKGNYGSDPASIAFDAIAHAKAHGITAVLIDSAGRQETNKSLLEELKKMTRVAKPDLKVFVGEAISGNSLLEQVRVINEAVGIDGIILTKLDVDAKGGNTLSILGDTPVPILFFGTGEKYTDIMPYDPKFIVDNMLPNN